MSSVGWCPILYSFTPTHTNPTTTTSTTPTVFLLLLLLPPLYSSSSSYYYFYYPPCIPPPPPTTTTTTPPVFLLLLLPLIPPCIPTTTSTTPQAASGSDAQLVEAVVRELCGLVPLLGLHMRPYVTPALELAVAHLGGGHVAIQVLIRTHMIRICIISSRTRVNPY